ncbi:9993_t:CDS:1, partial [Racocetra persica]
MTEIAKTSRTNILSNINQSFKVVRRQRQRKARRHSVLNQTLDNFYNILRRTQADQTVKSANNWAKEYETYRRSVIYDDEEIVEDLNRYSTYAMDR